MRNRSHKRTADLQRLVYYTPCCAVSQVSSQVGIYKPAFNGLEQRDVWFTSIKAQSFLNVIFGTVRIVAEKPNRLHSE